MEELPKAYWERHLNTATPTADEVISILVLVSKWNGEEVYDFTLPDEVTNYVLSVTLSDHGIVEDISMES